MDQWPPDQGLLDEQAEEKNPKAGPGYGVEVG